MLFYLFSAFSLTFIGRVKAVCGGRHGSALPKRLRRRAAGVLEYAAYFGKAAALTAKSVAEVLAGSALSEPPVIFCLVCSILRSYDRDIF